MAKFNYLISLEFRHIDYLIEIKQDNETLYPKNVFCM